MVELAELILNANGQPPVIFEDGLQSRLIGNEVLDASEVLRQKVQFEVTLTPSPAEMAPA